MKSLNFRLPKGFNIYEEKESRGNEFTIFLTPFHIA